MPQRKTAELSVPVEAEPALPDDGTSPEAPPAEGLSAAEAFIKAQSEIGNITKKSYNPGFRSKFVNLEDAVNAIIPVLNRNGFGVMQGVMFINGTPCLDTALLYKDGTELGGYSYPLVSKDPEDPQKVGGSLTYARRYSLMAIVGAAPEDDDGNAAATPAPAKPKVETPRKKLAKLLKEAGATDAVAFKKLATDAGIDVSAFADLTDEQVTAWVGKLEASAAGVPF